MNRLGIHISLFQLFVISTTHFSSPAFQCVSYVLWSPRQAHSHGRGQVKAEIVVAQRKRLTLAGPFLWELWARATVFQVGVRAPPVEDALVRTQAGNVSSVISIMVDCKEG